MAEDFDGARAKEQKDEILRDVRSVRDMLTNDIINYYWEKNLRDEGEVSEVHEGIRKYARRAIDQLNAIIGNTR